MATLVDIDWREAFDALEDHEDVDVVHTVHSDGRPVYFRATLSSPTTKRLNPVMQEYGLSIVAGVHHITLGVDDGA